MNDPAPQVHGAGPGLVSADSHVIEDPELFVQRLPRRLRTDAPRFPARGVGGQFQAHPGGWNPTARLEEMGHDGVVQEVLYPSLTLNLFGLGDPDLQAACLSAYNEWLVEYCSVAPTRLFGVAALSGFDAATTVAQLERAYASGLVGGMLWEVPPEGLEYSSGHYEAVFEAASALSMPISLHSLTGAPYRWPRSSRDTHRLGRSTRHANEVTNETANALSDLINTGVLERHPGLRLVLVESEASWIPFYLGRYDSYYERYQDQPLEQLNLTMLPSQYFERQVFATFFNDAPLARLLPGWGMRNLMWSNDYPHPNSTWPNSAEVIKENLGHLGDADLDLLLRTNVTELYGLPSPDLAVDR